MTATWLLIGLISGIVSIIAIYILYKDIRDSKRNADGIESGQTNYESLEEIVIHIRHENASNLGVSPDELDKMTFDEVEQRIEELEQDTAENKDSNVKRKVLH